MNVRNFITHLESPAHPTYPREVLVSSAEAAGWQTRALGIQNGDVYISQKKGAQERIAVMRFRQRPQGFCPEAIARVGRPQ